MSEKSTDYREYRLSLKERLVFGLLFLVASAVAFWLLFGIVWVGLPAGLALLPLFWKKLSESLCRRRHRILEEEFCTYMQLTAAALASFVRATGRPPILSERSFANGIVRLPPHARLTAFSMVPV